MKWAHDDDDDPMPHWCAVPIYAMLIVTAPLWLAGLVAVWIKRKIDGDI